MVEKLGGRRGTARRSKKRGVKTEMEMETENCREADAMVELRPQEKPNNAAKAPVLNSASSDRPYVYPFAGVPQFGFPAYAIPSGSVLPDLSVLISGPPIKDPDALLRNDLPIDNKAIREVQKPLEDIIHSLIIVGVKALDSVE
ncbi:Peptidyl-prolyl cis-trans isomerase, chloroplastic [Dendrobium catenatum]|uniref:peptidylprolyl isomerase n=1 Tax=Dendrobium catenatum TaxID=906689 RepID=A0A2I0X4Y6_9ASPA|nr:Peptidyl-prolyl cis-trans isomerase, chloroplastic [Dendrobium catenatum]